MQELIDFSAADIPAEFSAPTAAPAEMPLSPQQLKTAIAFAEKLTGRSDRQKMFLCEFLLWFFRMHIEKRDEKIRLPVEAPEWLRSLLQQIESYRGKPADLKTLLALSAKSQEHLCRTFHRFLGMPPSRYIHSLRMKQAREHLLHSNYSIIDIAYETGYDSLGYFYKIFRQTHGCSPGEYRRRVSRNPYLQ
jgi:AraC-like DNA-binding protein